MAKWNFVHGRYWMIQWGFPIFFSLGIHLDRNFRYLDLHFIFVILTIGRLNKNDFKEAGAWWSAREVDKWH